MKISNRIKSALEHRQPLLTRLAKEVLKRNDDDYQRQRKRTLQFENLHQGEECVIVGNGPSVNKTPLEDLSKDRICFGLNRINLLFDSRAFRPDYHVCVNPLVLEQCKDDFRALTMPRFSPWNLRSYFNETNAFFINDDLYSPYFAKSLGHVLWQGATVTYVAMQLAYAMGFSKVILVGVDHSFATKGPAHQEVTSQGDDHNHFHPAYFGKGFRWHLPDLDRSERAYALARETFESDGRHILDATIGGQLNIFEKVNINTLL